MLSVVLQSVLLNVVKQSAVVTSGAEQGRMETQWHQKKYLQNATAYHRIGIK